jgi:8-amino-7-oxononanoate synthase
MPGVPLNTARSPLHWAEDVLLTDLHDGVLRQPRLRSGGNALRCVVDGRSVVEFSSNDYLGLSVHPRVRDAAATAAQELGVGSTGSRHLSGGHELNVQLENELCSFEGTATATLAPSGYAANMAALEALGGPDSVIFSDELNHASIVDGCRASRSRTEVYPHLDLDALETDISRCEERAVIVSDAVFSTSGTVADVSGLMDIARRYDAWLVIDEAHATGVLGPGGRGAFADAGIDAGSNVVRVVTFSKALGVAGGAICGGDTVRQLLLQRGRPLIYSTALPHPVVAAVLAALLVLRDEPEHVTRLRENTALMHALLDDLSTADHRCVVPMMPLPLGDATRAMEHENALWERGWMVRALRPPTVPVGASRLRIAVSALHDAEDIRGVAGAIHDVMV